MSKEGNKCKNCGGDVAIRNPTGNCDHLYYPENVPSTPIHRDWEVGFDGKFNDHAYLEMPTINSFTSCIQKRNGMPASTTDIKSFIRTLLESHHNDLIEKVESKINDLHRSWFKEDPGHEWLDTCDVYKVLRQIKRNN